MSADLQLIALAGKVEDEFLRQAKMGPEYYPVKVPDGASGKWSIKTSKVGAEEALLNNLRHAIRGMPEFMVYPGEYKVLVGSMGVMMSNTQLEYRTNKDFIAAAQGDILIFGLGIGMVLEPLHAKEEVTSITVVELEPDVVNLVYPTYKHLSKLKVIIGNAFEFEPDHIYDHVFHDIWPDVCSDNLVEMDMLVMRYDRWARHQWCWSRELCERMM